MDTLSYKTVFAKGKAKKDSKLPAVERRWYLVDAEGETLGRLASRIAHILRGKNNTNFTPHVDCGDYVVVINAEKVALTGKKMLNQIHLTYSGYPGGQKEHTPKSILAKNPTRLLEMAVKGMLPKTKLGRAMIKKMFAYGGTQHPHAAQKPEQIQLLKKY